MTLETIQSLLLLSALINYGILLSWFLLLHFSHDWVYQLHSNWFRLSVETFDAIHYGAMAIYKVGVLLVCLVPYVALSIVA